MQCVILAGGLATRLRPITETVPKALVPVAGRPFLDYQLRWLAGGGVERVVLCIGHLGAQIRDFAGAGERWGLAVDYVDEGTELRGTAGALRLALDHGVLAERFGVLYGDSYLQVDVGALFSAHERLGRDVLMALFRNRGAWDRSNARLEGDSVVYDKTVADPEAAGMDYIDYGISIIERDRVVADIAPGRHVDLADVYRELSGQGRVAGVEVSRRFYEVGSPAGLAELEARLGEAAL